MVESPGMKAVRPFLSPNLLHPWSAKGTEALPLTERLPGNRAIQSFRPALAAPVVAVFLKLCFSGDPAIANPVAAPSSGKKVEHALLIACPSDSKAELAEHILVQTLDAAGEPAAYSMWIDSVNCRDQTCDVVKVRLHWDALGYYQRYEVALGSQLTKLNHVPFTKGDHAKLQRILGDPDSPLKGMEREAMTTKRPGTLTETPDGVDAVTGATILALKTAVVSGAGYTCYDLWHWSNGPLSDRIIRGSTGRDSSKEKLRAYLASDNTESALFALEYIKKRRITDPASVAAIIAKSKTGHEALLKPALACLRETAPSDQAYYDAIIGIFSATGTGKRLLILKALTADREKPVGGFYDHLGVYLPELESYFEVHLMLSLMAKRNAESPKVAKAAAKLLKHENFFISRRAYWHLEKQTLPASQRKLMDAYSEDNKERL